MNCPHTFRYIYILFVAETDNWVSLGEERPSYLSSIDHFHCCNHSLSCFTFIFKGALCSHNRHHHQNGIILSVLLLFEAERDVSVLWASIPITHYIYSFQSQLLVLQWPINVTISKEDNSPIKTTTTRHRRRTRSKVDDLNVFWCFYFGRVDFFTKCRLWKKCTSFETAPHWQPWTHHTR